MKIGDKVATLFFWLIATLLASFLIFTGFAEQLREIQPWLLIASAFGLAMVVLGLRQCWLSLRKSKLTG
jgi:hypothetical protein